MAELCTGNQNNNPEQRGIFAFVCLALTLHTSFCNSLAVLIPPLELLPKLLSQAQVLQHRLLCSKAQERCHSKCYEERVVTAHVVAVLPFCQL